jgi:hypothetical protein
MIRAYRLYTGPDGNSHVNGHEGREVKDVKRRESYRMTDLRTKSATQKQR